MKYGRYTLIEKLGTGGSAEVFRAELRSIEGFAKPVVIKCIHPHLLSDADAVGRFVDEAKLVVALDHPNIVQVIELGQVDGGYFIAMEAVEGVDLATLMAAPIAPALASYIMCELLAGLDYAHAHRVIHRDVSPHNIFLSTSGRVKVGDFGIAKLDGGPKRTRTGVVRGKLSYMAPEQARGESVDRRADIYAAGVMLHEMITGQRLMPPGDETQQLEFACNPRITVLEGALGAACMLALGADRQGRISTAAELAEAIRRAQTPAEKEQLAQRVSALPRAHGVPVLAQKVERTETRGPKPPPPQAPRKRAPLLIAAALLFTGVALTTLRFRSPSPSPPALPASLPVAPPPVAERAPAPPVIIAPGFLDLNSAPWAYAKVDGRSLGETPISGLALAPGAHHIELRCPKLNQTRTLDIDIVSKTTTRKVVRF